MIRKIFLIIMLLILLIIFSSISFEATKNIDSYSKDYYFENTYKETGSKNVVTGIYLDYRLFDSIFEAGILLVAVTGIIFMTKKDDEVL